MQPVRDIRVMIFFIRQCPLIVLFTIIQCHMLVSLFPLNLTANKKSFKLL